MNNRRNIFFTADMHDQHDNILKFCNRPFKNVEEQREKLIKRYNSVVPKNGICYFLGDMGKNFDTIKELLSRLNGKKIIITGNHDIGMNALYNAGFDIVLNNASLVIAKEVVYLSHYPFIGIWREDVSNMKRAVLTDNWYGETKHTKKGIYYRDDIWLLHGHLHLRKETGNVQQGRQWDVGVDGNNFTPVSLSQIESWISKVKLREEESKL